MSSGAINPIDNPQAYDFITLSGNVASPGACIVGEFKRAHEFDVKKGKGTIGATVTFVGRPPAKGSIKFLLWLPIHFAQWEVFRTYLKYDPTKKAVQAIDIFHPTLADIDINSVVVEGISNLVNDGNGLWTCSVDFLEYFPPPKKSAVSTPTASATNPGASAGTNPLDAPDAYQKQIASLLTTAQAP